MASGPHPVSFDGRNVRGVQLTLLAVSSLTVMAGALVAPGQKRLAEAFAGTDALKLKVDLVLVLPALFVALAAPVSGWYIDKLGRLRVMFAGLLVYAIGGVSGLFAPSLELLLISRAVLGVGVAALLGAASTLGGDYFSGAVRERFMGLQSAAMAGGGMLYMLLAGGLAQGSWRWPFAVYGIAILYLLLARRYLFEPPQPARARTGAPPDAPVPWGVIALLMVTGLLGMLFFYLVPTQTAFLLKGVLNINAPIRVAVAIGTGTATGAVVASLYRFIRGATGLSFPAIATLQFGLMGVGFWLLGTAQTYGEVMAAMAVNGLGMGFLMPNTSLWLLAVAPLQVRGRLVSALTGVLFLGQFLSVFAVQLFQHQGYVLPAIFVFAAVGMAGLSAFFLGYTFTRYLRTPAEKP